jgi:uncharacterized protein YbaP (TraB family)
MSNRDTHRFCGQGGMIRNALLLGIFALASNHALAKTPIREAPPAIMEAAMADGQRYGVPESDIRYTPKPAIWQFGDRDTTIYLFGSIHSLSYNLKWRSPLMDKLFANATEYAFESYRAESSGNIRTDNDAILDEAMPKVFHYNRPKLLDRVPDDLRAELDRRTKTSFYTMPRYIMNGMPSMFAIQRVFPEAIPSYPNRGGPGVESVLMPEATKSGKFAYSLDEITEVATALWIWDEKDQDALLVDLLRSAKANKLAKPLMIGGMDEGELRWVTGHHALGDMDHLGIMQITSARKTLLKDRNAKWVVKLVERLKRPGKIFVTVGAGHLTGSDSVQSMLEAQGIKVTRIQ